MSLIPGSGRFPGEGNGNPLQYSCLENPMDRRAWLATIHRAVTENGLAQSQKWHPISPLVFSSLGTKYFSAQPTLSGRLFISHGSQSQQVGIIRCHLEAAYHIQFSSAGFSCSVVSDSLQPHELQHARPPCPSPTPEVYSDSRPSSQRCHPAISSSVVSFSSCPKSLPASETFPMSQLFV